MENVTFFSFEFHHIIAETITLSTFFLSITYKKPQINKTYGCDLKNANNLFRHY